MQQMASNMGLLNPFVFNQFGAYGTYAQVNVTEVSAEVSTSTHLSHSPYIPIVWYGFIVKLDVINGNHPIQLICLLFVGQIELLLSNVISQIR